MNLTKAAAVLTLIVALVAAGYLACEATLVRSRYDAAVLACTNCTTLKESMAAKLIGERSSPTSNFSRLSENIGKPKNLHGTMLAKSLRTLMFRARIAKRSRRTTLCQVPSQVWD